MDLGPLEASDVVREITGAPTGQRDGLLHRRHAARHDPRLAGREEGQAVQRRDLHGLAAGLLARRRHRRLHGRAGDRPGRAADDGARLPRQPRDVQHVQPAAFERPDLGERGEQLPDGREAAGLRPAVLEQRRHAHGPRRARLVPAQHLHGEQPDPAGQDRAEGRADRPRPHRARHLRGGRGEGPHRPLGRRVAHHAAVRRQGALRARLLRPHRRHHQPAGRQGRLLDQRGGPAAAHAARSGARARRATTAAGGRTGRPGSRRGPARRASRRRWAAPRTRRSRTRRAPTCWRSDHGRASAGVRARSATQLHGDAAGGHARATRTLHPGRCARCRRIPPRRTGHRRRPGASWRCAPWRCPRTPTPPGTSSAAGSCL